jgi:hypothetical protein
MGRHALVARLRVRNYLITYYPQLVVVHEISIMKLPSWRQKNRSYGYDPDSLADVDKVSRCAVAKLQGVVSQRL